jgi:NTE family protein
MISILLSVDDANTQEEQVMAKKTALVLSGGGAKGAFQVGAEKYAREVKGYSWDVIAGVSVGALNGAMLAMQKYDRLFEIWNTVSNGRIYTGGFGIGSALKILFRGARSFYGNEPLQKLIVQEMEPDKIKADLRIGAVSLQSGEYVIFKPGGPNLSEAILASTVMPIIWTPVDISPTYRSMVDGGVRNASPLGDVLDTDPDEIVIINCGCRTPVPQPEPPRSLVEIGGRMLAIMLNEMFVGDMEEFLRVNALVKEAEAHGITLHHPSSGRPLKYVELKIIEPDHDSDLCDTLDFSQAAVQKTMQVGRTKAEQVLSP